eukprot:TRINITY_DN1588_c11_g1_i1.p1 TRINITY_DN1588_c11_g1~~TRINITY_DN1588_c11_g1_i1.p1  ORF type:complete len:343 (+),score=40.38 TRINITY_DN1588_c11_g1_i1:61-1029(+)
MMQSSLLILLVLVSMCRSIDYVERELWGNVKVRHQLSEQQLEEDREMWARYDKYVKTIPNSRQIFADRAKGIGGDADAQSDTAQWPDPVYYTTFGMWTNITNARKDAIVVFGGRYPQVTKGTETNINAYLRRLQNLSNPFNTWVSLVNCEGDVCVDSDFFGFLQYLADDDRPKADVVLFLSTESDWPTVEDLVFAINCASRTRRYTDVTGNFPIEQNTYHVPYIWNFLYSDQFLMEKKRPIQYYSPSGSFAVPWELIQKRGSGFFKELLVPIGDISVANEQLFENSWPQIFFEKQEVPFQELECRCPNRPHKARQIPDGVTC